MAHSQRMDPNQGAALRHMIYGVIHRLQYHVSSAEFFVHATSLPPLSIIERVCTA